MAFDLETATPVSSGFDISTAKPVEDSAMFPRVASSDHPKSGLPTATNPEYARSEFGKGVADLASFPFMTVDLVNKALKYIGLPMSDRPFGGSQDVRELVEKGLMTKEYQPTGMLQKILGGASRFVGASAVPSAATIGAAARPLSALTAEAFAAAEGGAGAEIGKEIGQKIGGRPGEVLGSMAGGIAGTITGGATPILADKLRSVIGPNVNKQALGAAANTMAAREVGGALNANPSSVPNMGQATATQDALAKLGSPGFNPTLAQASGAPAITSLEGNIARSNPEQLGKYAQNFAQNEGVIGRAVENTFPAGSSLARSADTTLRGTSSRLDDLMAKIEETQAQAASSVRGAPQQDVGAKLQMLRDTAQNVARGEKNSRITDLYATAEKAGVKENLVGEAELLKKLRDADANEFTKMPPLFGEVIRKYMPGDKVPVFANYSSFEELHSLYRATNSQLIAANRAGNKTQEYFLMQLKNSLGERLASFESKGAGEVASKLSDFNQWFSTKYAPAFYEGVGGRMAASNRFGDVIKPESVVGKFFTPSGIDDFNLVYQGNKDAQQALKDGVLGLFKDAAIKDGRIDLGAAQRFLRSNQETLAKVPDIAATLKNATTLNEGLVARATRLQEAQSNLDKTLLSKIAGEPDNAKVIQKALADPVYLRQLVATARTPSAQKAVARGIVDGIPEAAQKAGSNPLAFVLSNESKLRPALDRLDPKHFDNLLTIATARTIQGRVTPPKYGENLAVTDVVEKLTGSTPRTIWAQSANTAAGRQSSVTAVLHLLTRFAIKKTEQRADDLLKAVIYNPPLAAEMAKAAKMPFSIAESNKLADHLRNAGIRITVEASQPSQQQ